MGELRRTLGFWLVSAFILLNLVNTGIFFGVPIGAEVAGVSSLFAWIVLGIMSIYIGACFAELTTMFPTAGGVYEFSKQAFGRFTSFQIGWTTWMLNGIATALLVSAAVAYILPNTAIALGTILIPAVLAKTLLAVLIIIIMNTITYRGADESAKLMLMLSIFTIILLAIVIIPGVLQMHTENFIVVQMQWTGILIAAFLLSETFYGWESISFMAEEIKEPERTIPKALKATTTFVAIASVAVAVVMFGVVGIDGLLGTDRPMITTLETLGFAHWLILVANIGIVVTFLGNAAGSVIGSPRLLMSMSRDKLFIEQFSDIHPRFDTPYRAIILQTILTILIVIIASGAYTRLLEMLVAPSIILYAITIFLVPYFRWKKPDYPRPYRAPFGSWLPLVIVLAYLGILGVWAITEPSAIVQIRLLASFMLFSIPIYLLLTYFYDPDVLINTLNRFALPNLWFENLLIPKKIRREILEYLPEPKNKRILEFGSGVGSLTMYLAEHVGKTGKVYAVELGHGNMRILERRMQKLDHKHVEVIHDPHLINRVHPSVRNVDMVVGVGNLSYVQDVKKVLREMSTLMPDRGHICFVEYVDFFGFLPNPKWLSDHDELRKIFAEGGFSVNVQVKRGIFWKYLFIYGIKENSGVPYI